MDSTNFDFREFRSTTKKKGKNIKYSNLYRLFTDNESVTPYFLHLNGQQNKVYLLTRVLCLTQAN